MEQLMWLPEDSKGFAIGLATVTHYRLVNVLAGVACMKRSEQFDTFALKGLIFLGSTHPMS